MLGSRLDLHERFRRYLYTALIAGASLVCAAGLALPVAHAQVTTQVTGNGLNTTVTNTASGVEITGGDRGAGGTGPNLFHSFGLFNVGSGDTANFVNDSGQPTTNIIGRVTDARSDIFGTIQTTGFGAANLWLLNPKGFVFGPDATLDVGGSFHASTADSLKFTDGLDFVVADANPVLSVADPRAFGFLGPPSGRIDVLAGTVDDTTNPVTIKTLLTVPEGKTLSLVGGEVNIGGEVDLNNDGTPDVSGTGYLLAPGGRVNLVSVVSAGDATFDPATINGSVAGPVTGDPSTRDIDVSGFTQLGNINITQNSIVDAKEVSIRGGQLVIDTAAVYPGAFWLYQTLGELTVGGLSGPLFPPDGGLVDVNIAGDVSIRGDEKIPIGSDTDFPGILTYAGFPFAAVPGDVPDIRVNAKSLTMSGVTAEIQSIRFGPGKAADVSITADNVLIANGAAIEVLNFFQGPGGSLTVTTDDLVVDGGFNFSEFTGLSSQALFHPGYLAFSVDPALYTGDAGTITVNASNSVTLRNVASISASSFAFGSGGGVTVNTKDLSLNIFGLITAESTLGGPAGNVEINASGQVNLATFSQISSTTSGSGTGGNVVVNAGQSTTVSSTSGIFASTVPPNQDLLDFFASNFALLGITDWASLQGFVTSISGIPNPGIFDVLGVLRAVGLLSFPDSTLIPGNGGAISMTTPLLTVDTGGAVSSSTGWDGNAGQVVGNVDSLVVENGGEIRTRSGFFDPVSGEVSAVGVGNAGSVTFNAQDSITISGGSMSTTTIGDGNAGDISLTANQVAIQNGGGVTSESGVTINGNPLVGSGNAGIVTIMATGPSTLTLSGAGSEVSTTTRGAGAGGSISLNSAGNVEISSGGSVSADSLSEDPAAAGATGDITITAGNSITLSDASISTKAAQADGGTIKLTAPNTVQLTDSEITTSIFSESGANGGNINIDPDFVLLINSQIIANAFAGQGGNIQITAGNFIPSGSSTVVQASSQLGVQGSVQIKSPENNVAGSISQLPQSIVDVSGLLPESCAARHAGGRALSSFVVAGRGGLPTNPDNYLPSFGAGSAPVKSGGTTAPGMSLSELGYTNQTIVALAGWGCLP
jgi:filamentous hemagglutinin family protein